MNRAEQDTFDSIIDRYNSGVEPLENWTTADIVSAVRLLDAELQRRHDESSAAAYAADVDDEDDYDFDDEADFDDGERF